MLTFPFLMRGAQASIDTNTYALVPANAANGRHSPDPSVQAFQFFYVYNGLELY